MSSKLVSIGIGNRGNAVTGVWTAAMRRRPRARMRGIAERVSTRSTMARSINWVNEATEKPAEFLDQVTRSLKKVV